MVHACPKCNSEKTELLTIAFHAALSNLPQQGPGTVMDLARDMLGIRPPASKQGPETIFLEKVAPPQQVSYFPILACWFIATLGVTVVPTTVGTFAGYAILVAAGFALNKAYKFNTMKWPLLFHKWEQSYICPECGNIFEGK